MPGVNWGVYKTAMDEGEEISSTYEGRHITCTAAELLTDDGSGVATKGHACVFGLVGLQAVGVCFNTGTTTDLIAIDTEGIWALPVVGADDGGNRALSPGEPVFINVTTGVISGIRDNDTQIPFGYLLTEAATTVATVSAVKVHWDPRSHWLFDQEPLYFGDGKDVNLTYDETQLVLTAATVAEDKAGLKIVATQAAGHNELGLAWYADANYSGVMTATYLYGCGTWVNLATTFDGAAVRGVVAAQDNGIYATTLTESATTDLVYGMRAECITTATVYGLYAFSLNAPAATTATHRAIFYSDNTESVGHVVGHLSGVACGHIALAYVNGSGTASVMYVNCWAS